MSAVLELTVKDKDGRVVDHRIKKSESFVRGFLELFYVMVGGIGPWGYPVKNTGGITYDIEHSQYGFHSVGGLGSGLGIVVGTGSTAPTINDYKLEAQIAHGTGSGQLSYSAMTFGQPTSDASISQFTLTRDFTNASGASITVNEIGWACYGAAQMNAVLIQAIRDVIAGGIAVGNGQTLTVNYRIQVAV